MHRVKEMHHLMSAPQMQVDTDQVQGGQGRMVEEKTESKKQTYFLSSTTLHCINILRQKCVFEKTQEVKLASKWNLT